LVNEAFWDGKATKVASQGSQLMDLNRTFISALLFLILCIFSVNALEEAISYLVSFQDDAKKEEFQLAEEWLRNHSAEIVETVNEPYIKFIVAKMGKDISKFTLV